MITQTFSFLPGIKRDIGVRDWYQFVDAKKIKSIGPKRKAYYDGQISKARKALAEGDSSFFVDVDSREMWHVYDYFKDEAVFLDIETSGNSGRRFVTVVGLFDGYETKTMVKDINLDPSLLVRELERYKVIVTFNGSVFDVPYLEKYLTDLPKIPHFDLRHACARLGLTGGLKEVEKKLGIERQNKIIERLYGGDPLTLWRMYKGSGDKYYLNILVEYNEEDVINLKQIAEFVVKENRRLH